MSLATQCPHCRTTFKVAHDQLKLQSGLVRCGVCQEIFNGFDQLVEADEAVVQSPLPKTSCNPRIEEDKKSSSGELGTTSDLEQFSFIREAKTKKRSAWIFLIGIVILLLTLAGQALYVFRDVIAASYPPAKSTLAKMCEYAHCQIKLLAQIDKLSYEAEELHTLPREHTFEFNMLLRNHSALTQAWPHVELTLQNSVKQTVLSKVFAPSDYLSNPRDIANGFAAHQEHAIRLFFELDGVQATDYAVAIFYP